MQYQYWAKFEKKDNEIFYQSVIEHGISTAVALDLLIKNSNKFSKLITNYNDLLFFAALHDLGKIHIYFQCKGIKDYSSILKNIYPYDRFEDYENIFNNHSYSSFYHGEGSIYYYETEHNKCPTYKIGSKETKIINVGKHHDVSEISCHTFSNFPSIDSNLGNIYEIDKKHRKEMISICKEIFLNNDEPNCESSNFLEGLVQISDWIASSNFIPTKDRNDSIDYYHEYRKIAEEYYEKYLKHLGLIQTPIKTFGLDLFNFEKFRDIQKKVMDIPLEKHMIVIIEGSTGIGKTEAGIALASKMIKKELGDSLIINTPTQTLTNSQYARFDEGEESLSKKMFGVNTMTLNHSKSKFVEEYNKVVSSLTLKEKNFREHKTTSLWYPICVCTIDQPLSSILPAKRHNEARKMATFKGIMLWDEIHSFDSYTNELIVKFIERSKEAKCCHIMLSATMTKELKEKFGRAFNKNYKASSNSSNLITYITEDDFKEIEVESEQKKKIETEIIVSENLQINDYVIEKVIEHYNNNEKVAIYLNTVKDAYRVWEKIKKKIDNVILCHSRYPIIIKRQIGDKVEELFGKNSKNEPYIVITTQVLEMGVDLYFDFMVSQVTYISYLFQRLGRLNRTFKDTTSKFILITPDNDNYGDTLFIYKNKLWLHKTIEYFEKNKTMEFPKAFREGVEFVNEITGQEDKKLMDDHEKFKREENKKIDSALRNVNEGYIQINKSDDYSQIQTRDFEGNLMIHMVMKKNNKHYSICISDKAIEDYDNKSELLHHLEETSVPVPYHWFGENYKTIEQFGIKIIVVYFKEKKNYYETIDSKNFIYNNEHGLIKLD